MLYRTLKFNWHDSIAKNEGSKQNENIIKENLCFLSQRNEILSII